MGFEVSNQPIEGILMLEISETRPKITSICQISLKIQAPQNDFLKKKFDNFDVDNKMLCTCGSNEPFNPP